MSASEKTENSFKPFLSPLTVMAFAVGTSVGWGSLVVTSSTYLRQAGPLGSTLGLLIGMVIMLLVCRNYHYVANKYPDDSGLFSYTKRIFGYDRAFLITWFAFLLYISIFWANATAVPLFARYIFGNVFRFWYLYTIFGYEVYGGEILLTIGVIWLTALIMVMSKRLIASVMVILVSVFLIGITVCFIAAMIKHPTFSGSFEPLFVPDKNSELQITKIAFISPWAFIGFESVTHSSKEFNFSKSKLFGILSVSVIVTTALYIFVTLLSVTAYPPQYNSWLEYIKDLDNLNGIKALPAFYAAKHYLGNAGLVLLYMSLFSLVATSLVSNTWALSRLIHVEGQHSILSEKYAALNSKGIPSKAFILVAALSTFIPFLGRSAIGWIVDVTSIIATFVYGFISAAVMKCAKQNGERKEFLTGAAVFAVMIIFGTALLLPLHDLGALSSQTYLLFIIWSVIGLIFFHRVIAKDHARHFGKAIVVWVVLISFIIYLGIVWMNKTDMAATRQMIEALREYHAGTAPPEILSMNESDYVELLQKRLSRVYFVSASVVFVLFAVSVGGFISNYFYMKKYETKLENEVAEKAVHIIEMQDDFVVGMATMVESRDNSTGEHIRRTSDLVRILTEEMKKDDSFSESDDFYENVVKAAPMHDLGKIAVDDVILRKPGKFTPEEFDVMKTHAKEGAKIVAEILKKSGNDEFRRIAVNMAHFHHERVDGSGYPEKLKGDEIPLEARIMAIADVYDALVSKRVYKERMSFEKADSIIMSGMGTQFDSKLEKCYRNARPRFEKYYSDSEEQT